MAKSETKKSCFIIMPITTPKQFVERYKDNASHFAHVLEHLFVPALDNAGFVPISPKSTGSNVIQAEIIKQLSSCELVLCDMSILNPNVFYEFGIRTALDKPVALVVDDKTKPIPFDTSILNFHKYDSSLELWSIEKEKQELTKHVQEAYKKSKDHNALWKYFGVAQTGTFKPEDAEMGEKFDLIMQELSTIKMQLKESERPRGDKYKPISYHNLMELARLSEEETLKEKIDRIQRSLQKSSLKITAKEDKPQEPDSNNP
ncbi:MAG: hypothetical protein HQ580_03790 [Planctomycetes bacterium]|nr:hypothetical protein [Planctomycetota bacterium]